MKIWSDEDYRILYENKAYYTAWLDCSSQGYKQILLEDLEWKLPHLHEVIPHDYSAKTVAEVGCSVGHIIGNLRINGNAEFERWGFDVNTKHVEFGKHLYPHVSFSDQNVFDTQKHFDLLVLCDILEHLQDDVGFLKSCRSITNQLLVNIPLEKSFLARNRVLGTDSVDGHLRLYDFLSAKQLLENAGFHMRVSNVVTYVDTFVSRKILKQSGQQHPFDEMTGPIRFLFKCMPSFLRWYVGGNLFAFCD